MTKETEIPQEAPAAAPADLVELRVPITTAQAQIVYRIEAEMDEVARVAQKQLDELQDQRNAAVSMALAGSTLRGTPLVYTHVAPGEDGLALVFQGPPQGE